MLIKHKKNDNFKSLLKVIFFKLFKLLEKLGIHFYPVHFYSPIPDTRELSKNKQFWFKESSLTGIDFNLSKQIALGQTLSRYKNEFSILPSYETVSSFGLGSGYGEIEALLLYAMIRHVKPSKIIEVGSGISTFFEILALEKNHIEGSMQHKLICIEPYPYPGLKSLKGVTAIVEKKVQEIDALFFLQLEKGDILFIDSSHIVKAGSDVVFLYLEVLPNLKPGVIIHIHDIAFPFPTRFAEQVMNELSFGQEQYLVQALLCFNDAFKVLYCSSFMHFKHPDKLKETFPLYDPAKHFPSSLWIEKIK
jgi:hypothetical protein